MTHDEPQPVAFGRYELLRHIAAGGMGEIFLARNRGAGGFEKKVVIKRILPYLAKEEEFVTKFIDEAKTVTHLTHGNIVPVFDMGEVDGEYYIAMEYIPGRDLRDVIHRYKRADKQLPVKAALFIVGEMCKGLGYAHRKKDEGGRDLNIIHRDVSPSNVLISTEGAVKLVDFGIAKAADRVTKSITGRLQGKFMYMSPEQAAGKHVDKRSDTFSAGVVLYELLTNRRPFEGKTDLESLDMVRNHTPAPPSSVRPEIPGEVDDLVMRALAKSPEARYATIDRMEKAIFTYLYAHGGMTGSEVAEALSGVFGGNLQRVPDSRVNLDSALASELDRLKEASGSSRDVDPLSETAVGGTDSSPAGRRDETVSIVSEQPQLAELRQSGVRITPVGGPVDSEADIAMLGRSETAPHPRISRESLGGLTPTSPPQLTPLTGPGTVPPVEITAAMKRSRISMWITVSVGAVLLVGAAWLAYQNFLAAPVLSITSNPAGAQIWINGGLIDRTTPTDIDWLEPGAYRVRVAKEGFEPQELPPVTIRAGSTTPMPFVLRRRRRAIATRTVHVVSRPSGAFIIVGGKRKDDKTPSDVTVPKDLDSIEVRFPGTDRSETVYLDDKQDYFVERRSEAPRPDAGEPGISGVDAGPDAAVSPAVEVTEVRFIVKPKDAVIELGGRVIRGLRGEMKPRGVTAYRVSKPGYETASGRLTPRGKSRLSVPVTLTPITPPKEKPEDRSDAPRFPITIIPMEAVYCHWTVDGKSHESKRRPLQISLTRGNHKVACRGTNGVYRGSRTFEVQGTPKQIVRLQVRAIE